MTKKKTEILTKEEQTIPDIELRIEKKYSNKKRSFMKNIRNNIPHFSFRSQVLLFLLFFLMAMFILISSILKSSSIEIKHQTDLQNQNSVNKNLTLLERSDLIKDMQLDFRDKMTELNIEYDEVFLQEFDKLIRNGLDLKMYYKQPISKQDSLFLDSKDLLKVNSRVQKNFSTLMRSLERFLNKRSLNVEGYIATKKEFDAFILNICPFYPFC